MLIKKRLAGGNTKADGQRKAFYVIIPRSWVEQLQIHTGEIPEFLELELLPLAIVIRPAIDGQGEEVKDDSTMES